MFGSKKKVKSPKKSNSIFGSELTTDALEDVVFTKSKSSNDDLACEEIEPENYNPYNLSIDLTKAFLDTKYSSIKIKIIISGWGDKVLTLTTKERVNCTEPMFLESFNVSPPFLDSVKATFEIWSEEEFLGSFNEPLENLELEKIKETKQEFILNEKTTGKSISYSILLSRLIKPQEVLRFNFSDDFDKLGYVRDQTGLGNQGLTKSLEDSSCTFSKYEGVSTNSFSAHFTGFNHLDCGFNHFVSSEMSFSIWFKSNDDSLDGPLVSTISQKKGYKISTFTFEYYNTDGMLIKPVEEEVKENLYARTQVIKKKEWINKIVIFTGSKVKEYYNGILVNEINLLEKKQIRHGPNIVVGAFINDMDFVGFRGDIGSLKIFNYVIPKKLIEKEQMLRYE